MTDKDAAKLKRQKEKADKATRAAFELHAVSRDARACVRAAACSLEPWPRAPLPPSTPPRASCLPPAPRPLPAPQAQADLALRGARGAVLVRNAGGPVVRDLHLERLCVSNGGAELISDASVTLAFGRRRALPRCVPCFAAYVAPALPALRLLCLRCGAL